MQQQRILILTQFRGWAARISKPLEKSQVIIRALKSPMPTSWWGRLTSDAWLSLPVKDFVTTPSIRSLRLLPAFPWSWFIKSSGPTLRHPNPTEMDSSSCAPPMLLPRVLCYFSEGPKSFLQIQLIIERSNSAKVANHSRGPSKCNKS